MLAPAFSSAAIVPQSGPIRRYPTNRDASLPAEVAALGEPEYFQARRASEGNARLPVDACFSRARPGLW